MRHDDRTEQGCRGEPRACDRELQALRYVAGEMSQAESDAFEAELGEDVAMCELVADLVRVTRTIVAAETVLHRRAVHGGAGEFSEVCAEPEGRLTARVAFWKRLAGVALLTAASLAAMWIWPVLREGSIASDDRGGVAASRPASIVEAGRPPAVVRSGDTDMKGRRVDGLGGEGGIARVPSDGEDALLAAAWVRLQQVEVAENGGQVLPSETEPAVPFVVPPIETDGPIDESSIDSLGVLDPGRDSRPASEDVVAGELRLPDWVVLAVASESEASDGNETWQ